jgi:hypothetical protein
LKSGKIDQIEEAFNNALWKRDEWQSWQSNDRIFEGKITGCDHQGKLILLDRSNQEFRFSHGEISLLPE